MCKFILSDSSGSRNPTTDLICPRCYSICTFSSTARRVACLTCGWAVVLTNEQHAEIVEALAGITTLPIAAYLTVLALAGSSVVGLPA